MSRGHGYWATIDHVRTWREFDGPVRERIVQDGKLTAYTVGAIAIEYNLLNSLPWKGGFDRFRKVAETVNEVVEKAPDQSSLDEKLVLVCEIVDQLKARFALKKPPYSAATKLLWFVRPHGWTMFDRHAYNALFSTSEGRDKDVPRFYAHLGHSGFSQVCTEITIIGKHHRVDLVPDRVIDKLLMFRGSEAGSPDDKFGSETRRLCGNFLEQLPDDPLHHAAAAIEQRLTDWCPPVPRLRRPRSKKAA